MKDSLHDPLVSSKIEPPSERSTGLVFAGIALLVVYLFRGSWPIMAAGITIAVALSFVSFTAPSLLAPLNLAWFRLSLLINRIVTPAIMLLLFVIAFVPIGYLMRRWHDPLVSRRRPDLGSYWVDRDPKRAHSMRKQF